jgi:hypothetical protein
MLKLQRKVSIGGESSPSEGDVMRSNGDVMERQRNDRGCYSKILGLFANAIFVSNQLCGVPEASRIG